MEANLILRRITTPSGVVLVYFPCESVDPGQCVVIDDKYYVVARQNWGIGTVVTHSGSSIDLPAGTCVKIRRAPVGGYDIQSDKSSAIIITGGLGFAAGLPLVEQFKREQRDFKFIAYTRKPAQLHDVMNFLDIRDDRIQIWDTATQGRPSAPFDPIGNPQESAAVFFAGPRDLHEALRTDLDKRGLPQVKIQLNY